MKLYQYSMINNLTGEGKVTITTEEELLKKFLKYDLPQRRMSSKTLTQTDYFSGAVNYHTITRIS